MELISYYIISCYIISYDILSELHSETAVFYKRWEVWLTESHPHVACINIARSQKPHICSAIQSASFKRPYQFVTVVQEIRV